MKVGIIVWQFPNPSNTYIVNEIINLKNENIDYIIYSLDRPDDYVFDLFEEDIDIIDRSKIIYIKEENLLDETYGWHKKIPFCHSEFREEIEYIRDFAPKEYKEKELAGYLRSKMMAKPLGDHMLKNNITCIYSPFANYSAEVAMITSMYSKIPYGFSVHAYDLFSSYFFDKVKADTASFILPITKFNYNYMVDNKSCLNFKDKLQVRRINVKRPKSEDVKDAEFNHPFIFSAGRFDEMKGYEDAINAFYKFSLIEKDVHFVIAGDGPKKQILKDLAKKLDISKKVHFLGMISNKDVLSYIKKSIFTFLCSKIAENKDTEGLPTFFVESLSLGVPALGPSISGVPEIIEDSKTGYLFESENIEEASEKMLLLCKELKNPESKKIYADNCKKKVGEMYDNKKNINILIKSLKNSKLQNEIKFNEHPISDYGSNKIFEIGFFKSASTLLSEAIKVLEVKYQGWSRYFYDTYNDLIQEKFRWDTYVGQDIKEIDSVLRYMNDYDAFCDAPWRDISFVILDKAFPGSKFIFNDRDQDDWMLNYKYHIKETMNPEFEKLLRNDFKQKKQFIIDYFKNRSQDLFIQDFHKNTDVNNLYKFLGFNKTINRDFLEIDFSKKLEWT